jgi:hypothetical protein
MGVGLLAYSICTYYQHRPEPLPYWVKSGLIHIQPSQRLAGFDSYLFTLWTNELIALWANKFGVKKETIEEYLDDTFVQIVDLSVFIFPVDGERKKYLGMAWPGPNMVYIAAIPSGGKNLKNHLEWLYKHELSHIILWRLLYSEDWDDHHKLIIDAGLR